MRMRANTPWLIASLAGVTVLVAGLAWKAHAVNPDSGFYTGFGSPLRNASYSFPGNSKRVNYRPRVNASGCNIDTISVTPNVLHQFSQDLLCGCSNGSGAAISDSGDGGGGNPITAADDLPYNCVNSVGSGIQWGFGITN